MTKLNVRVSESVGAHILAIATKEGRTPSDVARRILTGEEKPAKASKKGRKFPRKRKATREVKTTH